MAESIKKAIAKRWKLGKRYNILEGKENDYLRTPKYVRKLPQGVITPHGKDGQRVEHLPDRRPSGTATDLRPMRLSRGHSMRQSVRDTMGTIRQVNRRNNIN